MNTHVATGPKLVIPVVLVEAMQRRLVPVLVLVTVRLDQR